MLDGAGRGAFALVILLASVVTGQGLAADAPAPTAPPVVAGFHRLIDAKAGDAATGELLLAELNCAACHQADGIGSEGRITPKGAPDLNTVGARVTPQWLRAYLANPHGVKPGATMPDVLHGAEPAARTEAVESLTHFLVSLGGPIQPATKGGNVVLIERGKNLYHTVGCVACHAPEQAKGEAQAAMPQVQSVPLGELASKWTVDGLADFLLDPLKTRPHGRMPASNLTPEEAEAVAVYLLREQMDNPQAEHAEPARSRGIRFAYYEGEFRNVALERMDRRTPKAEGKAEKFTIHVPERTAGDNFGFKFTGAIRIPRDGKYSFFVTSDDGTRVYLDGTQLIENDGTHGPQQKIGSVELNAGEHPIAVTYFEGSGGEELKVEWEGPGISRQEIPGDVLISIGGRAMVPLRSEQFVVDPQKAQAGRKQFASLGCASCHGIKGVDPQPPTAARGFAQLAPNSRDGCLAQHPRKDLPQYHLSDTQRNAITTALQDKTRLASAPDPAIQVAHALAAFNCYACHERGGVGGADASRGEHFVMTASFDMGDEGRLPPRLSGVGAKLKPAALEKIVTAGELHVRRHHMASRMPRFPRDRVAPLLAGLLKLDGATTEPGPHFSELTARDGRTLTGTKGMGCVNCHGVGEAKSLGMPSVNLSPQFERLQWPWFRQLLLDPAKVNPGTRMPGFWTDGHIVYKELAGGTVDGQIGAIWSYMSLGNSMPLPAGVRPEGAGLELIPIDEPIVHRTFMADVGPRAIAVGYPDNLHIAFDANQVRLAKAWRGRFFDAKGMWEGRGGAHNAPLGSDVINLPAGAAVAVLPSDDAPWPIARDRRARDVGGQFLGYRLDAQRRPVFMYRFGEVEVEELAAPVLREGGVALARSFMITGQPPTGRVYVLAAVGAKVEETSPGSWKVDDKLTVRVKTPGAPPVVRERGPAKQLLVPVELKDGMPASLEIELAW